jgi:dihydroorotase
MCDVLLKDARVIDPSQGVDGIFDVAIADGMIAALEADIPHARAKVTIPLVGKIVTPGLIDAHCHPVLHFTDHAVFPDDAGIHAGVLLVNDGGSAGAANFVTLREMYYRRVKTDMTFFLNIATAGLIHPPEIRTIHDIDLKRLRVAVEENRSIIKGLKLRALEPLSKVQPDVVQMALDAAEELKLPLMVHIGDFRERIENDPLDAFTRRVVQRLRRGDIISHYMTWRLGGMVLPDGTVFPELQEARDRGVLLDCSHGKNNFSLKVAEVLLAMGLKPDIVTTDLSSVGAPYVQSLLVTMSKFISLGMPLYEVIAAVTCNAAKAIGVDGEWGSLKPGRAANITVLEDVEGTFAFLDGAARNTKTGSHLLEPRLVLQRGVPLPCRSYYQLPNTE